MTRYTVLESPIDPILITAEGDAITRLYMSGFQLHPDWEEGSSDPLLIEARKQLEAYFRAELSDFDLPLNATGTEFQRLVWSELSKIPYGTTISYGELARRVGNPNGSRAVGLANGKNPISIVVPCHRVIGANGSLTGFGGGIDRKRFLLDLEKRDLFS